MKQRFSQAAWYKIKEYLGIYNLPSATYKSLTYYMRPGLRDIGALPPKIEGNAESKIKNLISVNHLEDCQQLSTILFHECNLSKMILVKNVYFGKQLLQHLVKHKSAQLYQDVYDKLPKKTLTCICGREIGTRDQKHILNNEHKTALPNMSEYEIARKLSELLKRPCNRRALLCPKISDSEKSKHLVWCRDIISKHGFMSKRDVYTNTIIRPGTMDGWPNDPGVKFSMKNFDDNRMSKNISLRGKA